jgi:hypothetical protein
MKTLKCNDLTYLEDAPIFKDKVAFKLKDEGYTVKESYSEYKYEKDITHIKESKCYGDNITDYDIKVKDGVVIESYKAEGPALFTYKKPATHSTKYIINREGKSIGYKISTGDIMNTTKTVDHIIFSKKSEEMMKITKEFFKGKASDGDNPRLNMLIDIRITNSDDMFIHGVETRTSFDADGNIEDLFIGNTIYTYADTGEFICVNFEPIYMSSDDDKRIVIPRLVAAHFKGVVDTHEENAEDNTNFSIEFYRKEAPKEVLATEYFVWDDETEGFRIEKISVGNKETIFIKIGKSSYTYDSTLTDSDGNTYQVTGRTLFPLSSDFFMFDEYQENISFAMTSYFDNIYETEFFGDALLSKTTIDTVIIKKNDEIYKQIIYDWNTYCASQKVVCKFGKEVEEELCITDSMTLPNGNKLVESLVQADPLNPKSIFYEAIEFDSNNFDIISSYKALAVKHIDR